MAVSLTHRCQNWWFRWHTKAITTKLHLGTKVVVEPHETQTRAKLISRASEGRRKVVTTKKRAHADKNHLKTNTWSKLKLSPQSSCIGWLAHPKSQTQRVLRQSLSANKLPLLRSVWEEFSSKSDKFRRRPSSNRFMAVKHPQITL